MNFHDAMFAILGATCVASGLLVITRKNPVYSVLFLLPMMLSLAVLYHLLNAPFIAAMQVLVYAGAIIVVFLFVIMLINLGPEDLRDEGPRTRWIAPALTGVVLLLLLGNTIGRALAGTRFEPGLPSEAAGASAPFGSTEAVGLSMFDRYVVPFELVSVLIVVAILGAILLSKERIR